MATYKTNSGKNKVVFFSNELADALSVEAQSCGKSPSWIVCQSLLEHLTKEDTCSLRRQIHSDVVLAP